MKCLILILLIYVIINCISADKTSDERNKHEYGEALKLIKFEQSEQDGLMESLNEDVLKKLLLHKEVQKRKIVVVSIVGGFRKGKTYVIDYCLRYLYAKYKSINFMSNPLKNANNWMGDKNESLKGFSFRSGSKSKNTEMVIWSDVFLDTNEEDGNRAIILMDTQGVFVKGDQIFTANSRAFNFGSLVSSVLIFNLDNNIKLDEMKYLERTTEFTKGTLECHQTPFVQPFQNLNFLLRNWSNIEQFPFGINEDNEFIMKSLDKTMDRSCMTNIKSSFENINSFLLPFPGNVIRLKKSTGCWSEMDNEYRIQLERTIEHILAPERLEIKKVDGKGMTGKELEDKIKIHFNVIEAKVFTNKFTKVYEQKLAEIFRKADPKDMTTFMVSHLKAKAITTELAEKRNPDLASHLDKAFEKAYKELNNDQIKFNELNVTIDGNPLKHSYGEALNVMCFNGKNNEIKINETTISTFMNYAAIKDRKVVVVSMTGLYRHGKSTFMDYCLRYMYANYKSINFMDNSLKNSNNWMGSDDELLTGFTFKDGDKREGNGVVFWSDVFLFDDEKGEKVAIFFVDSQGFFEDNVDANQSKILQFTTLISSIQIFNLKDNLNLKYLQFATDYAEFLKEGKIVENMMHKPLQKLLFLSRDWKDSDKYGFAGGKEFLSEMLNTHQLADNKKVQTNVLLSYDKLDCFILPDPGENITSVFNHGQLSMVSKIFKDELKIIIENLLSPTNLVTKKIGEYDINTTEFWEYTKAYLEILRTTKSPTANAFREKTVKIQMENLVKQCTNFFKQQLSTITIGDENEFNQIEKMTIDKFTETKTLAKRSMKNKYKDDLKKEIKKMILRWKSNPIMAPPGKPVKFMSFQDNKLVVNYDWLTNVTMHSDVVKRKLVVIAITGITGSQRTFLLNYCLRYMYANYKSINYKNNPLKDKIKWIGDADEPLKGFPLEQKDLNPIEFWSDVFLHTNTAGDDIAILFMISRGLFSTSSQKTENTNTFVLPSLISSTQIFNFESLKNFEIKFLLDAINEAKSLINEQKENIAPFQKMIFLMNWNRPFEHKFGFDGGIEYMKKEFHVGSKDPRFEELERTRNIVRSSYVPTQCFLLPTQGKRVQFKNYEGQWSLLDEEMKNELVIFIENVLTPSNLVTKKFNGEELIALEFLHLVKEYAMKMELDNNSRAKPRQRSVYQNRPLNRQP